MDIIQQFYNNLAEHYDKLFADWEQTTSEQAEILNEIFTDNGFNKSAGVLDCACGIGTQAIGLARLGFRVTASDISEGALAEAKKRTKDSGVRLRLERADFRDLATTFKERFDIVIAMDNALPHMLTKSDLAAAAESIASETASGGIFVASIRDYDSILKDKPQYSPPYIHKTEKGRRVCFQTWEWSGDNYRLVQYIIEDEGEIATNKFECEYRAVSRSELTDLLLASGFKKVEWKFPDDTGFYQPIVIAKK